MSLLDDTCGLLMKVLVIALRASAATPRFPRTKSNYRQFSGNASFGRIYVQTEQNRYGSVYFCMLIPMDPI